MLIILDVINPSVSHSFMLIFKSSASEGIKFPLLVTLLVFVTVILGKMTLNSGSQTTVHETRQFSTRKS